MDDHHHQPIWPMIQGSANYAWNLIEEAWAMIWKPIEAPQARTESYHTESVLQAENDTRDLSKDPKAEKEQKRIGP
jgi:hypothetical protein